MNTENCVANELLEIHSDEKTESVRSDESISNTKNEINSINNVGQISLTFVDGDPNEHSEFPSTYYTFSAKERLLLIFTENFRRQFVHDCPNRKPLILVVPNECGIQKFVSTTIRPTVFLFPELIDDWQSVARFISEFITYEPLPDPVLPPSRLISPDTLLKRRHGNCFEMATLLCSLLIGNRYAAMVVSGYASREVTNNDQQRVTCPEIPLRFADMTVSQKSMNGMKSLKGEKSKYTLREPIDLRSQFLLDVEAKKLQDENEKKRRETDSRMEELKIIEKLPDDELLGCRRHAWIVVLSNVDWAAKKSVNSSHGANNVIEPFFIEPTTGTHFGIDDADYHTIDAVWNEGNYYVNLQDLTISKMRWNFQDTDDWAILVNDETVINFVKRSETPNELRTAHINLCAKYLDMPVSWVNPYSISNAEFDERYPNGSKCIHYKRALLELFAPYLNNDGVMKRLTVFKNLDYTEQTNLWQWLRNRDDSLELIEKDFQTKKIIETYRNERSDGLTRMVRSMERDGDKIFEYCENSRLDGLLKLEMTSDSIRETFEYREDRFLLWREFSFVKRNDNKLTQIIERFRRNESLPFHDDILQRTFDITGNKIILQFQYGDNDITPTIRKYVCPPKPDYGCEIIFDEAKNPVDETNKYEKNVSKLKRYYTLLDQLRDQDKCIKEFEHRLMHIESTLVEHQNNAEHPILTFSIYDPLRNSNARSRKLAESDRLEREMKHAMSSTPDILAPYLVQLVSKPTATESLKIYVQCLDDIRSDYEAMLNHLKQQHENVCAEYESLKKFLDIVHADLSPVDYEHFIEQGHNLDISKRVLQQRIIDVEIEFEKKYQQSKAQLQKDARLTTDEIIRLEGHISN